MPAIKNSGDIDIHDIAFGHEFVWRRNAVADNMIYRRADGFGVALVTQRSGNGAMVADEVVAELIQFLGRNAGHNIRCNHVQRFGGQFASLAHAFKILRPVQGDVAGMIFYVVVFQFGSSHAH